MSWSKRAGAGGIGSMHREIQFLKGWKRRHETLRKVCGSILRDSPVGLSPRGCADDSLGFSRTLNAIAWSLASLLSVGSLQFILFRRIPRSLLRGLRRGEPSVALAKEGRQGLQRISQDTPQLAAGSSIAKHSKALAVGQRHDLQPRPYPSELGC